MTRLNSMTIVLALVGGCCLTLSAGAQPTPSGAGGGIVRAVLVSTRLPSVADAPRHFKVRRISVAAKQAATYSNGAVGLIFALSGSLEVTSGADRQVLSRGDGIAVAAGASTTFKATGNEPAVFLHFELSTADELNRSLDGGSATVTELFRTTAPIPGLKPGPYEFTLVRVTFPPRFPSNPPHRRSGAAMYYVLAGPGMFTTGGKTELKPAGVIHYEPYDLVHQWGNPGDVPLVLIQANISQEGVPAVIFVPQADPGSK